MPRKILAISIILCLEFCAIEVIARVIVTFTDFGAVVLRYARPYTNSFSLPALPGKNLTIIGNLMVRPKEPNDFDDAVPLKTLPSGSIALLVGGSSPFGHGVKYQDTFWGKLADEQFLEKVYVNASIPATSLTGASSQYAAALKLGPIDQLAVYAGDNEWAAFTYPKLKSGNPFYEIDGWLYRFDAYKIFSVFVRYTTSYAKLESPYNQEPPYTWFSYSDNCIRTPYRSFDTFSGEQVAELRARLLAKFSQTIDLLASATKLHQTKLLLFTTPIRYRLSPCYNIPQMFSEKFAETPIAATIEKLVNNAATLIDQEDYHGAALVLEQALIFDNESSLVNHYLGHVYSRLGRHRESREKFYEARNSMIGGAGMMKDLNLIVAAKAKEHNLPLVDLRSVFDAFEDERVKLPNQSRDEDPGAVLFRDWCHPTELGHQLIYEEYKRVSLNSINRN